MKVRPAHSFLTLADAIVAGMEIRTFKGLMLVLRTRYDFWHPTPENVTIEKYGEGIDERCGWDTHLVCVDGNAALFSDGPLIGPRRPLAAERYRIAQEYERGEAE